MIKINAYLLVAVLSVLSFQVQSAGFNCAKASTPVEKMICTDAQLSKLDELLKVAYKKALANSSDPTVLKEVQLEWLQDARNPCTEIECLKQVYTARLAELEPMTHAAPKLNAIVGDYQRYYHGKLDDTASISVQDLKNGQLHITGNAVWIGNVETGNVNTGELDGTFPIESNTLHYTSGEDDYACKLTLIFVKNQLTVRDDNGNCGGHNVTFNGQYRKSE